ncbi:MAG: GyrI-like domain-containing protein [Pseudomonadota bacterium]|uniref:AraC family transcriptional regulator n=1 Tax=Burkholderia sp. PAMC 28687 TaxID=1795874 RepID=UPI000785A6B8|nr:GyrI-like domain-containing protein [Burkholderia sp. PAMC 28687]AMM18088.1 DNA gyrase inhibitor [Burkholderia sp. PAMC 28687]MDP9153304.1 GyrI-like domain-containing protein [Pseudomonadota bacterium]
MTTYDVVVRDIPAMTVVSVDNTGPYIQISKAFDSLVGWLAGHDLLSPEIRMAGIYYDNPKVVPESELRSKACAVLPREVEVSPPVGLTQILGGQYAVLLHKGPYSEMHAAYEWLYGPWLTGSGREAADAPSFEVYLNSPKDTAPADWLTEICVPLL